MVKTEWNGVAGRECGDHRATANGRAWCFSCSEWCYPDMHCKGCEVPGIRSELAVALSLIRKIVDTTDLHPGLDWLTLQEQTLLIGIIAKSDEDVEAYCTERGW